MAVFTDQQNLATFVENFVTELDDDFQSPSLSKFQDYMPKCRAGLQAMEENLSVDKSLVHKLVGSMKDFFSKGEAHGNSMRACAEDLIKFGTTVSTTEPILGNNFVKFGTLLTQMSSLLSNLASSSKNIVFFSLNLLFENELKGSKYKSDSKAMFSQYQSAKNVVEREEKKALIAAGVNVTDRVFTAQEFAGKLIEDRRKFQLGAAEYMLKYNDVKTKRGVDLGEHLLAYYQAQEGYFKDGSTILNALKTWESKFKGQLNELRCKQDDQKKSLIAAKEKIRGAMGMMGGKLQGPSQIDPSLVTEITEKQGYLYKKPENTLRLRRQWPKRYCTVSMQGFTIANSHTHNPSVKIPVIHFQCKDCPEAIDNKKYCFKLIAQTKTYTFDAETEKELAEWKHAMTNCQLKLFQGEFDSTLLTRSVSTVNQVKPSSDMRQLVKQITSKIRALPGNRRCADCGSPDPEWLSVNLGILICIHCSGRHRELSVQYSRIRSLTLDQLKTHELLIALFMGNDVLNEVLEANVTDIKPLPESTNDFRGEYISKKYLQRKYIEHSIGKEVLLQELADAVDSRDIKQLLQVYAEGVDMCAPLPSYAGGLTALHLAIELEDLTSLHIVDFLLSNGSTENVLDAEGSTPLHLAVSNDSPQCIKLLLNHRADINTKNALGQTPLDIAVEKKYDECIELLQDASKNKFVKCEHIDVDWGVSGEGEDDIYQTPVIDSGMKRSDTAGDLTSESKKSFLPPPSSDGVEPALPPRSPVINGNGRRRPLSTFMLEKSSRLPFSLSRPGLPQLPPPSVPAHPSTYSASASTIAPHPPPPPPSNSSSSSSIPAPSQGPASTSDVLVVAPPPVSNTEQAPSPPPRTLSKNAEPINKTSSSVMPVAPKRKKRMSAIPDHPPDSFMVEALYDCEADHNDELGFKEGEKIMVTKKMNRDWWRGYMMAEPTRRGIFPMNYVKVIDEVACSAMNDFNS